MSTGAAAALIVGAWGMPIALADVSTGDKPVFVDVSPKRIVDTRFDIGVTNALSSGVPKLVQVTGNVPVAPSGTDTVVPNGATAVVLNVTAVNPSRAGFLSVRPGNPTGTPTTSNLNVVTGVTVPNSVTVGLPTGGGNAGKIQLWFQASGPGTTDVLVDVVGYYDDHRHDDRYYTKALTKALVFDQRVMVGAVDTDGSKIGTGAFSSSRQSAGVYSVLFDTTGLGIVPTQMPPNVVATASYFCSAGTTVQADWSGYSTFGPEVINFSALIRTYNAAAAVTDCSTQFHITLAAATSLVLPEPDTATDIQGGEFPPGSRVACRNEPEGAVCAAE